MVQQADYEVLEKDGKFELRRYPEILLATVSGLEDYGSFQILFDYIAGNNRASEKISMTAPVVSSEKIPMTAPVVSSAKIPMTAPVISGERFFTFVMPKNYTLDTIPKPANPKINIHVQAVKKFAVLRFSGRTNDRMVEARGRELLDKVGKKGLKTRGDVFLMRYNSPFAPGFMRRNEVGIEIVE